MMQEPKKPDPNQPVPKELEGALKGLNLDKFGEATQKLLKDFVDERNENAARKKKITSFFKTAKAALKGDEKAKEELSDAAAKTWGKLEDARESARDMLEKAEKKIAASRDKKPQPPKP
jgi:hypothetical protein